MFLNTSKFLTMPSDVDLAKRELVRVLRELAGKHRVAFALSRESPDAGVQKAFRQVSRKVHPDKDGKTEKMDLYLQRE